jgi:acyl-coenzyme A synthetase/AMP-(fatty) acid ligase
VIDVPEYFNFAHDVFDRWARRRPDAPALWWVEAKSGRELRLTFSQLRQRSLQAAQGLRQSGLGRGDRVVLLLPRIPDWWVAMLGLIRLGAVPVPCTPLLTVRDLAYRIESARVSGVITDAEGGRKLAGFQGIRWQTGEAEPGWRQFDFAWRESAASFKRERTRSTDPGILYFTSATTGAPKMVLHTQASYGLAHRITGEHWLDLRAEDVHWNIADVGWGKAAWSSFYGPWHQGACVFALETGGRFESGLTLETLARYPITTCCAPPTALRMMVRHDLSPYRFPHLRHCVTAGEPLNAEVLEKWRAATGLTLYEAYGQTETVVLIGNFRSQGHPVQPGSMGQAAPGFEVAVLDDNLQPLPPGREGEIAVRTAPNRPLGLFQEYWLNPEETARQFRGQWYLTGDRAGQDADGYFHFIGRKDDVIKSSGYRIGPGEVESALMTHPAVLDAAVIGRPDELRGQIVKAFVLLRPELAGSDDLISDLKRHCKELVAPYKYPREIEFVAELPKTISGKTRRVELRQRDAAAL